MQTEVGMTGVVWPNVLLIHWIYCVGVASSIRKVALRLSLNGKKESKFFLKKFLSFLLLLLLSPSFPQWFFFVFRTRVWNVTRVFVSPPTCIEWSERKTTLTAVATAWNTPAVLSSYFLSLLLPLSFLFFCLFFFFFTFLLLCVCFYFEKRPRLLLKARRQNTATISRMTRSFSAISFTHRMYLYKE